MPSTSIWLASFLGMSNVVAAQTVDFFYTQTLSLCSLDGASLNAGDTTSHGGMCAYRNDVARVYACPAPDPYCWNFAEQCGSSGLGQTVCNRAGTVWCCNAIAGETCTTTQNQINVCISNFTSPNSGISVNQAQQKYLSAIGVSNVTATKQTADPTPFSTRQLNAATSTSSSSASALSSSTRSRSSMSSSTSSATPTTSGTAAAQSTSGNDVPVSANSSGSGISGGAIAGIVVGAIVAIAIVGAVVFLIMRKKRSTSQSQPESLTSEKPPQSGMSGAYTGNNEKKPADYYAPAAAPSELGSDGHGRVEMPVSGANAQPPQGRYEMA